MGKGSRFAFEVVLAIVGAKNQIELEARLPRQSRRGSIRTVLVVENNMQVLEGIVELLQAKHYYVIPVVSTDQAVESLDTLHSLPSLIISDYYLDEGTDVEAIKALRRACEKFILAVMITVDHSSALNFVLQLENISFLGKPFKPIKLFELLTALEK